MRRWKKGERLEKGQEESFIEFAWSQGASSTRAISKGAGARLTEKDYAYLGSSWKDLSSHGIDKERASYHSYLPYMYIYIYFLLRWFLLMPWNERGRARGMSKQRDWWQVKGQRGGIYWAGSIGVVLSTLSPDVDKRRAATTRRSAEGGGGMVKSFRASIHLESEK